MKPEISLSADELYNRALDYLSVREHSRAELRRKLSRLSESESDIDDVLAQLAEKNLQSDERFAEVLLRSKAKNYGNLRLADELRRKGVAEEIIRREIAVINPPEQSTERALAVLRKKFGQAENDFAMHRKYRRFLAYRGFDGDTGARAVRVFVARRDDIDDIR